MFCRFFLYKPNLKKKPILYVFLKSNVVLQADALKQSIYPDAFQIFTSNVRFGWFFFYHWDKPDWHSFHFDTRMDLWKNC